MAQENLLIEEAIPVGKASLLSLQQEQLFQTVRPFCLSGNAAALQ
jgi:hypothetical protein